MRPLTRADVLAVDDYLPVRESMRAARAPRRVAVGELISLSFETRDTVLLIVGDKRIPAEFEPGHARADRMSAVRYVRFALTHRQRAALAGGAALAILFDHPNHQARAALGEPTRAALAEDLGLRPAAT